MDNVTHACAGALMAVASVAWLERRVTVTPTLYRTAMLVGIVAAELPDADLVYSGEALGMGKLGYLLHHRGHTHTVIFALVAGILLWALAAAFVRDARQGPGRTALLSLSLAGTFSHIVLDWTNNYGIHPWWPLDNRWLYGDAMFILEPWLWIASLIPLFFLVRRPATRVLIGLLTLAILGAAWSTGMVRTPIAIALTVAAPALVLALRQAGNGRRLQVALAGWLMIESLFFMASHTARAEVRTTLGAELRDVVLTPGPGDPFCQRGLLLLTRGDDVYEVAETTVAPWPSLQSAAGCTAQRRTEPEGAAAVRTNTPTLQWESVWTASVSELRRLADESCEIAAALRFVRVPSWKVDGDSVVFFDARYGEGGFASIVAPRRSRSCPPFVPPWTPPRSDLLVTP